MKYLRWRPPVCRCAAYANNKGHVEWVPRGGEGFPRQKTAMLTHAWAAHFHDYTLLWTECCLDFFLDGVHMEHVNVSAITDVSYPQIAARPKASRVHTYLAELHSVTTP